LSPKSTGWVLAGAGQPRAAKLRRVRTAVRTAALAALLAALALPAAPTHAALSSARGAGRSAGQDMAMTTAEGAVPSSKPADVLLPEAQVYPNIQSVSEPGRVTLEWRLPEVRSSGGGPGSASNYLQIVHNSQGRAIVTMEGFQSLDLPGLPALPYSSALVALPPEGQPSLQIEILAEEFVELPAELALVPPISNGLEAGFYPDLSPENDLYTAARQMNQNGLLEFTASSSMLPDQAAVLEEIGIIRGVRLARVVFYPLLPVVSDRELKSGVGARLAMTVHARITVEFSHIPDAPSLQTGQPIDPLMALLRRAVVNPDGISPAVRIPRPARSSGASVLIGEEQSAPRAVIEVEQEGLVVVDYLTLAAAGLEPHELNPSRLSLYRGESQIPLEWEGDHNESFEPGERLLFYAPAPESRYSTHDSYFLVLEESDGLRIDTMEAGPNDLPEGILHRTVTAEQNQLYMPDCLCGPLPAGRDGDRWAWDVLQQPGKPDGRYHAELRGADPSEPGQLKLWLIGFTAAASSPDHRVEAALNGHLLGVVEWDGRQAVEAIFDIPSGVLQTGQNELTLALPGLPGVPVEGVWLDAFEIEYALGASPSGESLAVQAPEGQRAYQLGLEGNGGRVYDVSDPDRPVRLTGLEASPAEGLHFGLQEADVHLWATSEAGLIHPKQVRPYHQLTEPTGADYLILAPEKFTPALEELVLWRESQGLETAVLPLEAVYDAYGQGRPGPEGIRGLLEAAYASWDPRPAYLLLVGDGNYDPKRYLETSSETFLPPYLEQVDPWAGETASDNRYVTLEGDDNLPDMLVGRLPARSLEETGLLVEKILNYERFPAPGPWPAQVTLVADNPDPAGDFYSLAERAARPAEGLPILIQRIYHRPEPTNPGSTAAVRQAAADAFQNGRLLVLYAGHASQHQWGAENFLHYDQAGELLNQGRLPVLLSMTCFTAAFHMPGLEALDEALLRVTGGGAAAAWGSTGLGIARGHAQLAEGFFKSVLTEGDGELGLATLAGKLQLAANQPAFGDLIDTYILLGDPAMRLNRAYQDRISIIFLPIIGSTN
jgi:hypothetical protein